MVPALLIMGNKSFGLSSSLRHICAVCIPAKIPFFDYDWKKEAWNLFFAGGIVIGGFIAGTLLLNTQPVQVNPKLVNELSQYGITDYHSLVPRQLFNWQALFTIKGSHVNGCGWVFSWLWNTICRRLHFGPFNHGSF